MTTVEGRRLYRCTVCKAQFGAMPQHGCILCGKEVREVPVSTLKISDADSDSEGAEKDMDVGAYDMTNLKPSRVAGKAKAKREQRKAAAKAALPNGAVPNTEVEDTEEVETTEETAATLLYDNSGEGELVDKALTAKSETAEAVVEATEEVATQAQCEDCGRPLTGGTICADCTMARVNADRRVSKNGYKLGNDLDTPFNGFGAWDPEKAEWAERLVMCPECHSIAVIQTSDGSWKCFEGCGWPHAEFEQTGSPAKAKAAKALKSPKTKAERAPRERKNLEGIERNGKAVTAHNIWVVLVAQGGMTLKNMALGQRPKTLRNPSVGIRKNPNGEGVLIQVWKEAKGWEEVRDEAEKLLRRAGYAVADGLEEDTLVVTGGEEVDEEAEELEA